MKKKFILILLICSFNCVNAQVINFSDLNFKNKLLQSTSQVGPIYFIASDASGNNMAVDDNHNGEIEVNEAQAVYMLDVQHDNISNLSGIEFFTNLIDLNCADNLLTSLDVSALTNLQVFRCDRNDISYLNTNGLDYLRSFWYGGNNLPNFNVNAHPSIAFLGCDNNQITNLDVSNLPSLTYLQCYNNSIQSLDLSNQAYLRNLHCDYNLLTDLDVSMMLLTSLHCNNNPLVNLNMKVGNLFSNNTLSSTNMNFSDCPTLSNICVDNYNIGSIQNKVNSYGYVNCSVNSNCNLSADSFEIKPKIKLFPNPTSNILNIESNYNLNRSTILVYNQSGQVVSFFKPEQVLKTINVSKLPEGIYLIKIITDNETIIDKFIKE